MKWIGFDRNDPDQRKFEFEDTEKEGTSPPTYSARLLDTNEIITVNCENVFKLKPTKPFGKKKPGEVSPDMIPPDIPKLSIAEAMSGMDESMKEDIMNELKPKTPKVNFNIPEVTPEIHDVKPVKEEDKVKPSSKQVKGTITREQILDFKAGGLDVPTQLFEEKPVHPVVHKYEYKTILDTPDNIESLTALLNKLGEEGWELVGFNVIPSMLSYKSSLFCVMKRNKQ